MKKKDDFLQLLQKGVDEWNRWREDNPLVTPMLEGAKLTGRDLRGINLSNAYLGNADLCGARLSKADLYQTEFWQANLSHADFTDSELAGAKFHNANLSEANFTKTRLYRVDFIGSIFNGTKFFQAVCGVTTFSDVELDSALDLDSAFHVAPSHVDSLTLSKVQMTRTREFLNRCGVPARYIFDSPIIVPIEPLYQSVFISYSHNDESSVDRLFHRLKATQMKVWYAPEEMKPGAKLHEQIDAAIEEYDRLVLILSESSMNSRWVATEIRKARRKELRDSRRVLFPLRLCSFDAIQAWSLFDSDTGTDLAEEIRAYYIPDITSPESPRYEREITKLIESLENIPPNV
ncbi:MAG: toll/interleukin-1 receptor domain-containing protein [Chlorobiaceae bacterium]|nr:toll/interleukin-1 receptor domain-containing protein [Chlorobiaceae bacterium]